jgi:dTDP-4-dehydrorhamnose reductase
VSLSRTMRILITGATGQLGRELIKGLNDDELLTPTHKQIDIRDPNSIKRIVDLNPEIIIHTAAYTDVDGCEENHELAWDVNSFGTKNIATAAEEIKAKLIYISTDYVFDGKKKEPYLETDRPNPLNIYGKSKYSGENYVRDICSRFIIIRTSWLYGKEGKNFVYTILTRSKEREELKVVNDQIGCPTNARDLAESIKKLIPSKTSGIYHASGEGECSWYEFALEIVRLSGIRIKVIPITSNEISRKAPRPSYAVLRNSCFAESATTMRHWRKALTDFFRADDPITN